MFPLLELTLNGPQTPPDPPQLCPSSPQHLVGSLGTAIANSANRTSPSLVAPPPLPSGGHVFGQLSNNKCTWLVGAKMSGGLIDQLPSPWASQAGSPYHRLRPHQSPKDVASSEKNLLLAWPTPVETSCPYNGSVLEGQKGSQANFIVRLGGHRFLRTAIEQFGGRIESLDLPIVAADSAAWLDRHDPRWLQEACRLRHAAAHLFQLGKHHYLRGNFFHAECYLHGAVEAASTAEAISLLASCYAAMDDPHRLAELLERFSSSFDSTPTPLVELADQRLYLGAGLQEPGRVSGRQHSWRREHRLGLRPKSIAVADRR